MRVNLKNVLNLVKVQKSSQMVIFIQASILMVDQKEWVSISGKMGVIIKVNLKMVCDMGKACGKDL